MNRNLLVYGIVLAILFSQGCVSGGRVQLFSPTFSSPAFNFSTYSYVYIIGVDNVTAVEGDVMWGPWVVCGWSQNSYYIEREREPGSEVPVVVPETFRPLGRGERCPVFVKVRQYYDSSITLTFKGYTIGTDPETGLEVRIPAGQSSKKFYLPGYYRLSRGNQRRNIDTVWEVRNIR
jgi:hypothetical protein